jgi:lipopolysaccharide transport system permease protein
MIDQATLSQNKRTLLNHFRYLMSRRELLVSLTMREIKARYRQSILGFGWALLVPLFQMVVLSIVFGNIIGVPSDGRPYPVFSYVAILPWTLFSSAIAASVPSILGNMELVTKIYFPREILPLSSILARLVDFAVASTIYIGLILYYQIPVHKTLVFVPVLLVIQITLSIGIGLLGSAVSVFLRDISFAIPVAMQIWMYATPVIYPSSLVSERWRALYMLNPMAGIIDSYRKVVLDGVWPDFGVLAYSAVFSVVLCLIAYWYFKRLEMAMSDII